MDIVIILLQEDMNSTMHLILQVLVWVLGFIQLIMVLYILKDGHQVMDITIL